MTILASATIRYLNDDGTEYKRILIQERDIEGVEVAFHGESLHAEISALRYIPIEPDPKS